MPPPPIIPMTEAERMSDSKRSNTYEMKLGSTWGTTPKAITCSRPAPFHLPGVDRFHRLAQQLSEHPSRVESEGEHAREGAEAHRGDEHEREHELVDGPHHVHHPAGEDVHDQVGRRVAGAEH